MQPRARVTSRSPRRARSYWALVVNVTSDDVPPPGAGFVIVIWPVPAEAVSAAGIKMTRVEPLMSAVASGKPFHSATELALKPEPDTTASKSGPPAAIVEFVTSVPSS